MVNSLELPRLVPAEWTPLGVGLVRTLKPPKALTGRTRRRRPQTSSPSQGLITIPPPRLAALRCQILGGLSLYDLYATVCHEADIRPGPELGCHRGLLPGKRIAGAKQRTCDLVALWAQNGTEIQGFSELRFFSSGPRHVASSRLFGGLFSVRDSRGVSRRCIIIDGFCPQGSPPSSSRCPKRSNELLV